jgi:hypothetical protein
MPNILSLGFHFSKWSNNTALGIMERSSNFTEKGFPVDYFWLDLPYTNHGNYFDFNPLMFPAKEKELME